MFNWVSDMAISLLLSVLLLHCACVSDADRADTWDYCECRWDDWKAWSDCTSTCFGTRVRTRSVWLTEHPGCDEFTDCATSGSGSEEQGCNAVCQNGGTATGLHIFLGSSFACDCRPGYHRQCCTERVNCGSPASIQNGRVSSLSTTYYGGTAVYTCNTDYRMKGGNSVRTCQDDFSWSGSAPRCIFSNHCRSSPCKNGGSCINHIGYFTCQCSPGWSGQLCEYDIQPPLMVGCSGDVDINTKDQHVQFNWSAPTFSDPMSTQLDVVSNYRSPGYKFPWGDHTVQYVATKISNGLQTECVFKVKVRPYPCKKLNVPGNGARLCNGWKTDYGQFCMVTCRQNFTLSLSKSFHTWYVCGASGSWIPADPLPDCEVPVNSIKEGKFYHPEYAKYVFSSCHDDVTRDTLQTLYIELLKKAKGFSSFCSLYKSECRKENVDVQCSS